MMHRSLPKKSRVMHTSLFFRKKLIFWLLFTCLVSHGISPAIAANNFDPASNKNMARVLSVNQETTSTPEEAQICSQTIVSDRQLAERQEASKPWYIKYWQPILGGVIGGIIGKQMGRYYGSTNNKWKTPTLIGGLALGALLGPGFALGSYGLGALSEHYWPTKLPLEVTLSLVGGILGDAAWKMLFPKNPPSSLLDKPEPGEFLAEQQFFLETTCFQATNYYYQESTYRVSYAYQGQTRNALLAYEPQETIEVDLSGTPVNALPEDPL
jgi:uncharacterized protein YcfJ